MRVLSDPLLLLIRQIFPLRRAYPLLTGGLIMSPASVAVAGKKCAPRFPAGTPCPGRPTSTGDHKEKETKTTKNEKISPKIPNAFVFLRYLLFKTNSGTAPQAQVPAGCRMPEVTPTITTKRRSNLTAALTCLKRNSQAPVRLRSRQAGAPQNVYDDLYFTEQPYGLV